MFLAEDDKLWVHRLDILPHGLGFNILPRKRLAMAEGNIKSAQLCIATGRLCAIMNHAEIRILDFIRPP